MIAIIINKIGLKLFLVIWIMLGIVGGFLIHIFDYPYFCSPQRNPDHPTAQFVTEFVGTIICACGLPASLISYFVGSLIAEAIFF